MAQHDEGAIRDAQRLMAAGMEHHKRGDLDQAERLYREAVRLHQDNAQAWHYLGLAAAQRGNFGDAIGCMNRAIALDGTIPAFHFNLGNIHRSVNDGVAALRCYRGGVALNPESADAWFALGQLQADLRDGAEAARSFSRALELRPGFGPGYYHLGLALAQASRFDEAAQAFRAAIANGYGAADCHNQLGIALGRQRQYEGAAQAFRSALALAPDLVEARGNLAAALARLGQISEAADCYRKAIAADPGDAVARANLASMLLDKGDQAEALSTYRQALEIDPGYLRARSNFLFALTCSEDDPASVRAAHDAFHVQHAAGFVPMAPAARPAAGRRLRIGYVSPDFCSHPVGYFMESLLAHHDAARYDVHCYDVGWIHDETTARLQRSACRWVECANWPDQALAERIVQDGIDILVDLAGHTAGNRMLVFARKPAPVQIAYLGYSNTTGLAAVDYRITDGVADPEGATGNQWREELLRLPGCYYNYTPPTPAPAPREPRKTESGRVAFGCFASLGKVTPLTLDLWASVLRALPESTLTLKAKPFQDPQVRSDFLGRLAARGVAAERLTLLGWSSYQDNLETYRRIDIGLDTYPFNLATNTCEAIWMGTPVVTLAGRTHAGRMGASLLGALGLPELVARSTEQYVQICRDLAHDTQRLAALQGSLRDRLLASSLTDGASFARHMEAIYAAVWRRHTER